EQLRRKPGRLRPSAICLQRFVEFVAQIALLLFCDQSRALLRVGHGVGFAHSLVPFLRPEADAFAAYVVDVSRASKTVQSQGAALERDAQRLFGAESVRPGELLQRFAEFARERRRYERLFSRRSHTIELPRGDRL